MCLLDLTLWQNRLGSINQFILLPNCHFFVVTNLSLPNCHFCELTKLPLPNCRYQIVTLPNCHYQIVITELSLPNWHYQKSAHRLLDLTLWQIRLKSIKTRIQTQKYFYFEIDKIWVFIINWFFIYSPRLVVIIWSNSFVPKPNLFLLFHKFLTEIIILQKKT